MNRSAIHPRDRHGALRFSHRMPDWFWVALPTLCTGAIAWLDLVTKDAGITGQLFFLWPVRYAATFLRRHMVYVVLGSVFACEAVVVFTLLPPRHAITDITGLTTTLTMAAVIIVFLRKRRDELLDALESEALGVAVLPDHAETVDELLAASDAALYEAKIGGRDRTACAPPRTGRVSPRRPATAPPT